MIKTLAYIAIVVITFVPLSPAHAQRSTTYRVGGITAGGAWYATIDGLRAGLKDFGLEEGKQLVLDIRETKGDVKAAEEAAKSLEQEKVSVIYTTQTSISIAAKRVTTDIPVVFCAGAENNRNVCRDSFCSDGDRCLGCVDDANFFLLETFCRLFRRLYISLGLADVQNQLFPLFEPEIFKPRPQAVNRCIPRSAGGNAADSICR